jgi:anaerobic ribonucleoside-triphosphate reductase activating protein
MSQGTTVLQVAQIVDFTEAEGPGIRFALWLQGCPLRCPGCCNPEMLSFDGGTPMSIEAVLARIESAARDHGVEGITLLGGEPLAHAAGAVVLARAARERGLTVMVFSGFTVEEAQAMPDPNVAALLDLTDILVDGPYLREQPDTTRRWIGSMNQRIHFLTDRYHADDDRWRQSNTLEIRLQDGQLSVNGFPARSAVGLWRRPRFRRSLPVRSDPTGSHKPESPGVEENKG